MSGEGQPARAIRGSSPGPFSEDWRLFGVVLATVLVALALLPGRWVLLHPVVVGGLMARLWWTRGRDPEHRAVTARYEPPDGLSPAEVGILVDHTLDMRDVTATLADLAHRGYLDIEEDGPTPADAGGGRRDFAFVRTSEPDDWTEELESHERDLLFALFAEDSLSADDFPETVSIGDVVSAVRSGLEGRGASGAMPGTGAPDEGEIDLEETGKEELFLQLMKSGGRGGGRIVRALYGEGRERIRMSELEDSFYVFVGLLHSDFLDRLDEKGYYRGRPGGRRGIYVLAAVGAVVLMWFFGDGPLTAVASIATGLVIGGVGWIMPARTKKGARALAQARGFAEFLDRVEEDRLRRMIDSPDDFEAHLPYAIALGVDGKWADAFSAIYSQPTREQEAEKPAVRMDWSGLRAGLREEAERHGVDEGGDGLAVRS